MERPFETVRNMVFDLVKDHKVHSKQLIEQIDGLMVWIVGFSIGGLSLIVSDLAKFDGRFTYSLLKVVLILLCLSIISGIVFRIACYMIQLYNHQITIYMENCFSNKQFMEIEPYDLTSETNIQVVLHRLQADFGENASNILEAYSNIDISNKSLHDMLLNDLKEYYKEIGEWAKRDFKMAEDFAKDIMKKAYGYSTLQIEKAATDNTSVKWQFWLCTAYISFGISCLGFISVITIFCFSY